MKNPMIEANINEDLFEAIDENEVNGGLNIINVKPGNMIISSAMPSVASFKNKCLTVITRDFDCNNHSVRICELKMHLM